MRARAGTPESTSAPTFSPIQLPTYILHLEQCTESSGVRVMSHNIPRTPTPTYNQRYQGSPRTTRQGLASSTRAPPCARVPQTSRLHPTAAGPRTPTPTTGVPNTIGERQADAVRRSSTFARQPYFTQKAASTPAAGERGVSGDMMGGEGVLKGARCNGAEGSVRRARSGGGR